MAKTGDTQIIRIKYEGDIAALQQSKTAAQQAQQATDSLRNSAQKFGTDGAAASNKFKISIGSVKAELEKTKTLIETTSRSDTKLLNERIAKYKQLRSEVDQFNKKLQETDKSIKSNASSFSDLGNIIKAALSVAALRQIVSLSLDMATLAGNVEGVSRAFNTLPNSTLILDSLRKGTHGTVTDLELMQKALQANNFKIPIQQLGTLFEFAATKAQQTGQEVNHLVDYIVSGIGYRSIKRLDDLGFTANRVKEALGGVSLQAASMQQVMDAITKLMNEDLQKTGGYAETAATKVGQLGVAWVRMKQQFATSSSKDGGFIDFMNDLVEGLRLMTPFIGLGKKGFILEGITAESIKNAREFIDSVAGKDAAQRIEDTQQKMNSLQQTIGRYNDQIKESQNRVKAGENFGNRLFTKDNEEGVKRLNQLVQEYGKTARGVDKGGIEAFKLETENARKRLTSLEVNKKVLEQTIVVLKQYFATLIAPPEVSEHAGLIAAKLQEIEDAGDRLKGANTVGQIHNINNELARLNAELADLKAFGTTKQFLEVNGKIKLVPVVDPKGFQKTLEQEPIFKEGVTIPAKIGFTKGTRSAGNQLSEGIEQQIQDALKNIPTPNVPVNITPMTDMEKIGQEFAKNWKDILGQGLNDTGNFLSAIVQSDADMYDQRLNQARSYYDNLILLSGDNEKRKQRLQLESKKMEDKLRREAFEADKKAKKSQAAINGAVGITNAFATLPYPAAIVASLLIAASTAAQIAIINKETPKFAKGKVKIEGPGTRTSDSINAKISRGESVINATSTERSMKLLEGINSGKIDDRILKRLHITQTGVKVIGGMDDSRIVSAIKGQRLPDLQRVGRVLQEVQTLQDGFSKRVRRKSMSR
jgi:hypothetical protein